MPFKSEAQRRWMYANKPEMAKEWERETSKRKKLPKRLKKKADIIKESTSKADIHRLATKAGIPWDNDPKFKRWSKKVTGKSHLDGMNRAQLKKMEGVILDRHREKTASEARSNRKTHSQVREALDSFFKENNLPKNTPHAILAGGSMHLQGMRREFRDVDIFVPGLKKKKVDSVHKGLEVDAGNTLFDKDYSERVMKNRVRKDGLQLMSLPDVLEFKLRLNRPKDKKDIKALKQHLKTTPGTGDNSHVLVTGHSGSGKTTLADSLSKKLGLPIVTLDKDPKVLKALKDQGNYAKTHDGRLDFKKIRKVETGAAKKALASKTPSIIEGTYLSRLSPQELKKHRLYLVDTPKEETLRRRVSRQHTKDLSKGRVWSSERAAGVRYRGEQIRNEYESGMASWRKSRDVIKIKAHTRNIDGKLVKIRGHERKAPSHVEMRAKARSDITSDEISKLRKYVLKRRLRRGETYHYTWPGRGHAVIGDVGKKEPKHVVKTIYKPSDSPPGRRLMVKLPK